MDGQRTPRDIYEALGGGATFDETAFLELVFCLSVERYLLDLGGGSA